MKRICGHLNLDAYFKTITSKRKINMDKLKDLNIIEAEEIGESAQFWFKCSNKKYLFKILQKEISRYSELISEELANVLGLKSAHYDLAIFKKEKGVITEDFKKEGYEYIHLTEVMKIYMRACESIKEIKDSDYYVVNNNRIHPLDIRTNLYDIWAALRFYLFHLDVERNKIPTIVEDLMITITDYFVFQIISGNYDMHADNIIIEHSLDNKDISIAPLFDNEDMFKLSREINYRTNGPRLTVDRNNVKDNLNSLEVLEFYLKESDEFFINRFHNMILKIDDQTIYRIIEKIENRISSIIPYEYKMLIITEFNLNLYKIKNIFGESMKKGTNL